MVDCGPGNDTVYVEQDAPDRGSLAGCEAVVKVPAEAASDGSTQSLFRRTARNDLLEGTGGIDSIFGAELHAGPGDDTMAGRGGHDTIAGDEGDDRITGDRGADVIDGGPGDDEIFGNLDPDRIQGGPGNDRINVVGGSIDVVSAGRARTPCSRPRGTSSTATARACAAELLARLGPAPQLLALAFAALALQAPRA